MSAKPQRFSICSYRQVGTTSIEYAILSALIAVVIAGSVGHLGSTLLGLYQTVASKVECSLNSTC